MRALAFALALAATPAAADVAQAVNAVLLPGFARFTEAADTLAEAARADCRAEAVRPAFQQAWDAWAPLGDIRIGPSETGVLSIVFWPDNRGFTARKLAALAKGPAPDAEAVAGWADQSIAARGLTGLEMLLYDDGFAGYAPGSTPCALVQVVAGDLAAQAEALEAGWQDYAQVLLTAGAPDNATYLDAKEAIAALYTQILTGIEFTADNRIGNPMGTFEKPEPRRAEGWRSGRSLANVERAVEGAVTLARALSERAMPATGDALRSFERAAGKIGDPAFADIGTDPSARFRMEVLQQWTHAVGTAIEVELGAPLGLSQGFNSADGD